MNDPPTPDVSIANGLDHVGLDVAGVAWGRPSVLGPLRVGKAPLVEADLRYHGIGDDSLARLWLLR